MANIRNVLSSTQIALEREAASQFGDAVEDFTRGVLGIETPRPSTPAFQKQKGPVWYASSYASALAGGTSYRPKLKFLFKVEFRFKPGVLDQLTQSVGLSPDIIRSLQKNEFTFLIKTVDRPKVDFEYEDDVNQYNFRTKVLKRIRHRELTVTFLDDTGNRVFDFFRVLMMIYSPITQRQMLRDNTSNSPEQIRSGHGMLFDGGPLQNKSHRAVINTEAGQALEFIRIRQMFMDPSNDTGGPGPKEVTFDFINPRLVSFDLDDLSHETSDPNLLTMAFDYDWMEMVKVGKILETNSPVYEVAVPGVEGAPSDILHGSDLPGSKGTGNPFFDILARQSQRAVQQVTATAINRAVRSTFGSGRFATDLGGRVSGAVAGGLGGLVGGAVTGIVSAGSRTLFSGLNSTPNMNSSRASQSVVADSTTAGGDRAASYSASSDAYQDFNPQGNNP